VLKFSDNGKPMLESYELLGLTKSQKDDPAVKAAIAGPAAAKAEQK